MRAIKLGSRTIRVLEKPEITNAEGEKGWGGFCFECGLIALEKGLNPELRSSVLLHELIHAVCEEYAIEMDELDVKRLGHGLSGVFKNNRHLVKEVFPE